MKKIAIVEDNTTIRTLIQKFIAKQENYACTQVYDAVEPFLADLKQQHLPDVVLMDIDLPGMNGIEGMKLIKSNFPSVEIIMLTVYHDSHRIFDSLCAGASGYLLKHTSLQEIKESIEVVLNGGSVMSPQIARKVIGYFAMQPNSSTEINKQQKSAEKINSNQDSELTMREQEIVIGLVDGLSYKMIADRMTISLDTVRAHIRNIYKKLHVNSKAEVIAKSLRGEIG
ncbi:MAG: response regulator transcription factor [Bacteroidetes bacterium]|nr:response regulator transcription factor [Bacteroidota bacterium]NCQ10868.1 response regulator transcription factor [Bacteroidota bacterium]